MILVINKNSAGGKALSLWEKMADQFANLCKFERVYPTESQAELDQILHSLIDGEDCAITSASGDGGVHHILNRCIQMHGEQILQRLTIGAIGLGSSNDFHKPMSNDKKILDRPYKVDSANIEKWDIGKAVLTFEDNQQKSVYFTINASIGLTAEGNAFFNRRNPIISFLKRIHVEVANFYTICHLLLKNSRLKVNASFTDTLTGNSFKEQLNVSNLGILKKRNVSGGMSYDTLVTKDDGLFDIVLSENLSRLELIRMIVNLYNNKFRNQPKNHYWQTNEMTLEHIPSGHTSMSFEADGEVYESVSRIELTVLHKKLKVCT
jgi:diacylglycerol kinase (ATP)